ncbi:hypothetical protein VaNZ11_007747 [Volvox africanus]|uniref:RING-type E3 ubiquitin transferase n=1 Tax=Volvox africanus TaxID=51714 RepID=A0ABQ5S3I7_9CHLO|nr:hypothetical protein VaNZ11_007747 [Volvox africanus]
MDVRDADREIAYRRIYGLEAGMAGAARGAEDPPRCCAWLIRCFRCFASDSDECQETTPRSRALENHLYQYEAPQAPSGATPVTQPQRQTPAFVDDVDVGPLLPKTAESSAPLPRPMHSRNNSSASATPSAAAVASTSCTSEPLALSSRRNCAPEGQLQNSAGAHSEVLSRTMHHRSASHGEGWARKAPKVDGVLAAVAPEASAVAASVAIAPSTFGSGATSTAAGRPGRSCTEVLVPVFSPRESPDRNCEIGAAFGPVQDEDDDFCPTCLEAYTSENPKIFTECGHHFHMPCIYAWLERKDTCPMCESPMQAPGM